MRCDTSDSSRSAVLQAGTVCPQGKKCLPEERPARYGRVGQRARCGCSGETPTGRAFAGPPPRLGSLIWNNQTALTQAKPVTPAKATLRSFPARSGRCCWASRPTKSSTWCGSGRVELSSIRFESIFEDFVHNEFDRFIGALIADVVTQYTTLIGGFTVNGERIVECGAVLINYGMRLRIANIRGSGPRANHCRPVGPASDRLQRPGRSFRPATSHWSGQPEYLYECRDNSAGPGRQKTRMELVTCSEPMVPAEPICAP